MEKKPESLHDKNKSAGRVSALPCLLMIILSPLILLYFLGTLLFLPVDYLIFRLSRYRRDFAGKYHFLSGAHRDNRIYTRVKKNGIPIVYAKGTCAYEARGVFFTREAVIRDLRDALSYSPEDGWLVCGEPDEEGKIPSYTLADERARAAAECRAITGLSRERCVLLVPERQAGRYGEEALALLRAEADVVPYTRKNLTKKLEEIARAA